MQRSLIDVYSFKPLAVNALTQAFGDQPKCVGLQGSYLRGEATPDSDIDLLIILDDVNIDDLELLRSTLRSIPDGDRTVGFACGRQQMVSWPLYELFQFAKGTKSGTGIWRISCRVWSRATPCKGRISAYPACII